MRPCCIIYVVSLAPICAYSLSWHAPLRDRPDALLDDVLDMALNHPPDVELTGREPGSSVLPNQGSLHLRSPKPDCFRHAARQIETRCGDLALDEDGRVRAAISMTLCELKTARYSSLPLECQAFSADVATALQHDAPYAPCVEAISRSTQFWASYSGYLREIPQLCFAFQRGNTIDEAHDIYRNATLEHIAFLRLLSDRDENSETQRSQWAALVAVRRSNYWSFLVEEAHSIIHMQETKNTLSELRESSIAEEASAAIAASLHDKLHEMLSKIGDEIADRQKRNEDDVALAFSQHIDSLSTAAAEIPLTLSLRLVPILDELDGRLHQMVTRAVTPFLHSWFYRHHPHTTAPGSD
ncbi:hypothetical protein DENSPDRAFT_802032 [Dentipellis sp. KUC8613]|nr:hypothetical protein DENSPDRAFT_802032 [Dentipellis sp. KUC8613]